MSPIAQLKRSRAHPLLLPWMSSVTSSALALSLALSLLLSACMTEYELERAETRSTQSVGEVAFEVLEHEAQLSARAPAAKVARLEREREGLVGALDVWLSWPQLHALADELYAWELLYDEPTPRALLSATSHHLERLADNAPVLSTLASHATRARLNALSPYAPSALSALARPGFERPLAELTRWAAAHDGHRHPELTEPERSHLLRDLLIYAVDVAEREVSLPPLALNALELLWRPLPAEAFVSASSAQAQPAPHPYAPYVVPFAPLKAGESPTSAWGELASYGGGGTENLSLSLAYAISLGVGEWWRAGALGAAQRLVEALLPEPVLALEPLLNAQAWRFPSSGSLRAVSEALLELIDSPHASPLLGYLAARLPQAERPLAELLNALSALSDELDVAQLPPHAPLLWRERGLISDLIDALSDLLVARGEVQVRLGRGALGATLTPHEATLAMIAGLIEALNSPLLLELPRVSALMMASRASANDALPPLGGAYDQCALRCEAEAYELLSDPIASAQAHLACLPSCSRGALLQPQTPSDQGTQSAFERSLALIRDFAGQRYELKVTRASSTFFEALSEGTDLDPDLLPPLLEIDDIATSFLSSVIGELELVELVSPQAIGHPQVELLLDGFDLICEEGSLSNDLLNNLLPRLTTISEEVLHERCARFVDVRLDMSEQGRREQLAVFVTILSLLTDVPMNERPRTGELIRFFNLERPAVDLGLLDLELSQLTCSQGYTLRAHHGYALYAGEAAGLYQALSPLIRLAHRYDKLPALARLLGALYTHYGADERPFFERNGQPELSAGTGLVHLEPTLELLLSSTHTPRLLERASELLNDSALREPEVASAGSAQGWRAARWADTRASLGLSEGAWEELRAASASRGGQIWRDTGAPSTRVALLSGALLSRALTPGAGHTQQGRLVALWRAIEHLLDELGASPEREAQAEEALEALWAQVEPLFERSGSSLTPQLASRLPLEGVSASLGWLAEQLGERFEEPSDGSSDGSSDERRALWREGERLDELVSHPATFALLALAQDLRERGQLAALDALLEPLWGQPLALTALLYQLSALATHPQLPQLLSAVSPLLDPRQPSELPQALLTLVARLTLSATWEGWGELLSAALTSSPINEAAINEAAMGETLPINTTLGEVSEPPLITLLSAVSALLRLNPSEEGAWSEQDLRVALSELARWLRDERTGLLQALDIISARAR